MKTLKIIGIVVLGIVVVLGILVAVQPSQGHIEKTIIINAPPSAVFAEVSSFKRMNSWSPWAKMDPEAKFVFEGPESGVGSKMSWDGPKTGKGTQWTESSEVNQRIKNGLSFEGYEGKSYAEFVLAPEGDGTKVTWTYDGANPGIAGRAMWLVMKSMLSNQFDQGLNDLKRIVESTPQAPEVKADSLK